MPSLFIMANQLVDSIGSTGYGSFGRSTDPLNRVEDAVSQIRKNTEKLRSIGRRIGTPSNDKAALQIEVNNITKNTLEVVEQCSSRLRDLRSRFVQSKDLARVNDTQQRVFGAVGDFQRLSKEIMQNLQYSGNAGGRESRPARGQRRNQRGSRFESDGSLSLSGSTKIESQQERRAHASFEDDPEQCFEDSMKRVESELEAIDAIMDDLARLQATYSPLGRAITGISFRRQTERSSKCSNCCCCIS